MAVSCMRNKICNITVIIFPIAIAYSMGQIMKSVCVCQSVLSNPISTLNVRELPKFSRLIGNRIEEHDGDVRF